MLVWERRAPNLENNEKEKNKIGVTWMIFVYRRKLRSLSSHWRNITWIILFLRSGNGQRVKTTWTTKREKRQQNKNKLKSQTLRDTKKMFWCLGFCHALIITNIIVLTSVDVCPIYRHVLVSVGSALFVPESNHVTYLMHHHVMILTTGSNRYFPAFIPRSTHCAVTTGIRKVQRNETWHFSVRSVQLLKILRNAIHGVNCRVED